MNDERLERIKSRFLVNYDFGKSYEDYRLEDCISDVGYLLEKNAALKHRNDFLSTSLDAHAAELDRQSHRARFYSDLTSGVLSYLSGMCNKLSPALRLKVWDYIDRLNLEETKFNEDYIGFKFTKPTPPTPLQFFAGIDTSKLYEEE